MAGKMNNMKQAVDAYLEQTDKEPASSHPDILFEVAAEYGVVPSDLTAALMAFLVGN